jgi:hypothetical protein
MGVKNILNEAFENVVMILGHAIVIVFFLGVIWGIERLIEYLWGHDDPICWTVCGFTI